MKHFIAALFIAAAPMAHADDSTDACRMIGEYATSIVALRDAGVTLNEALGNIRKADPSDGLANLATALTLEVYGSQVSAVDAYNTVFAACMKSVGEGV